MTTLILSTCCHELIFLSISKLFLSIECFIRFRAKLDISIVMGQEREGRGRGARCHPPQYGNEGKTISCVFCRFVCWVVQHLLQYCTDQHYISLQITKIRLK